MHPIDQAFENMGKCRERLREAHAQIAALDKELADLRAENTRLQTIIEKSHNPPITYFGPMPPITKDIDLVPAGEPLCICKKFRDTGGYRVADLNCPIHGVEGTDPGDGPWDDD
jgi:hypothetical protein